MPTFAELFAKQFNFTPTTYPTLDELMAAGSQSGGAALYPSVIVGADPTGNTDSTAAFNAAILALPTTGSALFIPQGQYTIAGALNPIPANCTVTGVGEFSTTLNTSLASGTFMPMNGANSTITNLTINNSNGSNTAVAVSMNANQLTMLNVTVTGFGSTTGCVTMTSSATFGGLFNVFVQSSLTNAVGLTVAGADTSISGCVFNLLPTGMLCAANDRFSVVDCIYKSCTLGLSLTNTAQTGSTTFGGLQFDSCTTGLSVTPGNGQAVQAATFDACVFDAFTTGASIAPTGSGTVKFVDFDGCDFISTVNSALAVVINGAANSVSYVTCDGCDLAASGTSAVGFTYTAGGNAAQPITFVNCDFVSSTQTSPAVGSANTLPFVVRFCAGVNPVGALTSQPAVATSTTNGTGADCMVAILIGSTATTVSVGGTSLGFGAQTSTTVMVRVPFHQTLALSQTTGVTTVWFGD